MQVEGNPTCAELGLGQFSFKVDPPRPGTYALDERNTVTLTMEDSVYIDWTATLGIDAVIVKGGPNANVYIYDPEASEGHMLSAPRNPNMEMPYGLSHVDFCFDYEVVVAKTARATLMRQHMWGIDKTSAVTALTLARGEVYTVPYQVRVWVDHTQDRDFAVAGQVRVTNPAPMAATVLAVTDIMDDRPVALDCDVSFPYQLAPGATITCAYAIALPTALTRVNQARAATVGPVGPGGATAIVDFTQATVRPMDACVSVQDEHRGDLGSMCQNAAPGVFEYTLDIGPYQECGWDGVHANTARLVTGDTAATVADTHVIAMRVPPCDLGCTLTAGYWKTHSSYGPARHADATWTLLPSGPDTPFFLSGATYHRVMWTAPAGNAYYILAHAYIAAELNHLNGATLGDVQASFDEASGFFGVYTPGMMAALGGRTGSPVRAMALRLAATLDQYNNGLLGPGHCSE